MRPALTLAVPVVLAGALTAQTTKFYLPKGTETTSTNVYDQSYFGTSATNFPVHVQHMYALADMPQPVMVVNQLAYRRNNYYGNTIYASTQTLTLHLSHGANAPSAASSTFANNEGASKTKVFDGAITGGWPAAPYSGPNPAPFVFIIKLNAPYRVIQTLGKSLTLDYMLTARDHKTSSGSQTTMLFDAAGVDGGARASNGPSSFNCKDSAGKYNNSIGYRYPVVGGTWYVRYSNLLPNRPVVVTISGYGMPPNNGPWPIPFDLNAILGLQKGCQFQVGLDIPLWIPIMSNSSGQAQLPNITMPAGTGGVVFYDHGLVSDPQIQGGWVTTWSSRWTIGTGLGPDAATIYKTKDTGGSATGSVRSKYAMIMEGQ